MQDMDFNLTYLCSDQPTYTESIEVELSERCTRCSLKISTFRSHMQSHDLKRYVIPQQCPQARDQTVER